MGKGAATKRADHSRACDHTGAFSKDWTRLSGSGRYDMNRLKEVMLVLVGNNGALGPEWKNYPLRANGPATANATSAATSCRSTRSMTLP